MTIEHSSSDDFCYTEAGGMASANAMACAESVIGNERDLGDEPYTWDELEAIEKHRRTILKRGELPFWKVLSFYHGTCLEAMSHDWLIRLTVGIFVAIRVTARFEDAIPDFVQQLGKTDIGIIGGFLSFFLVLFVNQSNTRFNEMYKASMASSGKIHDVAGLIATTFPRANAFRMVRYLNAAHVAAYVGLNPTYTKREFFDKLNDIQQLLSAEEMERVSRLDMDQGADAAHEIIQWAMMDVQRGYKAGYIDAREAAALKEKILQFRGHLGTFYDYTDQPIHFFYQHFLCLLSALYLPLFSIDCAYSSGIGDGLHWSLDMVNFLLVVVQSIFVIGLRILGQKMVDPYGADLEDLSVLHYVRDAWRISNRILSAELPGDVSPELEAQLEQRKESIGAAWDKPAASDFHQQQPHHPDLFDETQHQTSTTTTNPSVKAGFLS